MVEMGVLTGHTYAVVSIIYCPGRKGFNGDGSIGSCASLHKPTVLL